MKAYINDQINLTLNGPDKISKNLEKLYGASFDCGVEKTGDNHIMKFYLESINNEFLPTQENLSKECMEILLDIIFNPYIENNQFNEEYINGEKENLKQIIQGKIDNKAKYASERCIEEMYKNQPYGLYKFGYIEDLENINSKNLYDYYLEVIKNAKIDIFVSGQIDDNVLKELKDNEIINNLNEREPIYNINKDGDVKEKVEKAKVINESMQITQGKLILGLDVLNNKKENLNDFKEPAEKVNTFLQTYNRCQSHLDDKTKNSLKIKPLSTLVLLKQIYNQFKTYEEDKSTGKINHNEKFRVNKVYKKNFKEDAETLMTFSNINFYYIIVYEFGFLTPNKSHKKRDLKQYFKFLKNINPYPFDVTIPVNEKKFVKVVLPNIKSN